MQLRIALPAWIALLSLAWIGCGTHHSHGRALHRNTRGQSRSVITRLADPDGQKRLDAIRQLAALQDPEALPELHRISQTDPDDRVREAALEAIDAI